MSQIPTLIKALKTALKLHGLTYRDVAQELGISVATVKRQFAQQSFSLQRLEDICQLLGLEISNLVNMMEADYTHLVELTEAQENELVSDSRFLLLTFLVINHCQFDEIITNYRYSETDAIQYLARLDRLRLIDLLPNNRIRLKTAPNFTWRRNGPIQAFFVAHLQQDFLNSRFEEQQETFYFLSSLLSGNSHTILSKRLKQLAGEFNALNRDDATVPFNQKFGHGLFLALRPWRADVFDQWKRPENEPKNK